MSAILDELGVMVPALAGENIPVIESRRVAGKVPFADHSCVITGLLQYFGNRRLPAIESVENRNAVHMAVLPGENCRSAGRANGIYGKTIQQAHAIFGNTIEIWRLIYFTSITAHGVSGVIVRHDENNVEPRFGCLNRWRSKS